MNSRSHCVISGGVYSIGKQRPVDGDQVERLIRRQIALWA
jgi:hypothetical protein